MDQTRSSEARSARLSSDSSPSQRARVMFHPLIYRFSRECGLTHAQAEDVAEQALAATAHRLQRSAYVPLDDSFRSWLQDVIINRVINLRRLEPQRDGSAAPPLVDPVGSFERIWREELGDAPAVDETSVPQAIPETPPEKARTAIERSRQYPVPPPTPNAKETVAPILDEAATSAPEVPNPRAIPAVQPAAAQAAVEPHAGHPGETRRRQATTTLIACSWAVVLIAAFGGGMAMGVRHRQDEASALKAERRETMRELADAQQRVRGIQELAGENDTHIADLVQTGQLDQALALCEHNVRIRQALSGNSHATPEEAAAYRTMGDLFQQKGLTSEALENHLRSLKLYQTLVRDHPHNRAQQLDLAWMYGCVARDLQDLGFDEEALSHYKTRLKIHEELANSAQGEREAALRLRLSLRQVAELQEQLGDAVAAQHTRQRLLDIENSE